MKYSTMRRSVWRLLSLALLFSVVATAQEQPIIPCVASGGIYHRHPHDDASPTTATFSSLVVQVSFDVEVVPQSQQQGSSLASITLETWSKILLQPALACFFEECRTAQQRQFPASVWEYFPSLEQLQLYMEHSTSSSSSSSSSFIWQGTVTAVQASAVNPAEHALAQQHLTLALEKALQDAVALYTPSSGNELAGESLTLTFRNKNNNNHDDNNNESKSQQQQQQQQHEENHSIAYSLKQYWNLPLLLLCIALVTIATTRLPTCVRRANSNKHTKPSTWLASTTMADAVLDETENSESSSSWDDNDDGQELVVIRCAVDVQEDSTKDDEATTAHQVVVGV